jgi:succinate dehydrogenase hydrophobic anchor subunit
MEGFYLRLSAHALVATTVFMITLTLKLPPKIQPHVWVSDLVNTMCLCPIVLKLC